MTITVDNSKLNNNDKYFEFTGQQVTLTNKGVVAETVNITIVPITEYTITPSVTSLSVPASSTATFTLSGKIPVKGLDEGNHSNIGTLNLNGNTSTLNVNVLPMLQLNKIRVYINGNAENIQESDDKVSNLQPGDQIELKFFLENLFDSDYDNGDMDGNVRVQLDDSNFGGDGEIDEDVDFTLKAGDGFSESDAPSVKFTIPMDADEDTYTLSVKAKAKADNSADYEIKWDLNLKVERKSDDVRIASLTLTPLEISCVRTAQISAKIINFGSNDQKYSAVSFSNAELGIDKKFDFALQGGSSKDNSFVQDYMFTVDSKVAAGTYPIKAQAFYEYNVLDDQTSASLVVKDCVKSVAPTTPTAGTAAPPTTGSQQVITSTLNTGTTPATTTAQTPAAQTTTPNNSANLLSSAVIAQSIEDANKRDDYIVAGLLTGIVLVFLLIMVLLLTLLRR